MLNHTIGDWLRLSSAAIVVEITLSMLRILEMVERPVILELFKTCQINQDID
jgi:hypothetical protein